LVPAAEVAQVWAMLTMRVKSQLLAFPNKAAAKVAMCRGVGEIATLLRGMMHEALEALGSTEVVLALPPAPADNRGGFVPWG
jgi:hypothetical protein